MPDEVGQLREVDFALRNADPVAVVAKGPVDLTDDLALAFDDQRDARRAMAGDWIVLACPGSGSTRDRESPPPPCDDGCGPARLQLRVTAAATIVQTAGHSPSSAPDHSSVRLGCRSCSWPIRATPDRASAVYQAKNASSMETLDT
jgi:hypothetical protein